MTGSAIAKIVAGSLMVLLGLGTAFIAFVASIIGDPVPGQEAGAQRGKWLVALEVGVPALVLITVGAIVIARVYDSYREDTE